MPDVSHHGLRALTADLIGEPDRRGGRVYRSYGRRMIRRLAAACPFCPTVDRSRERIRRMHRAYRRRWQ